MNGMDNSDDDNPQQFFGNTACIDDSFETNTISSQRPKQTMNLPGKVCQIVVDSDDDISSGANESSEDDVPRKQTSVNPSNGLKRLPLPGQRPLKKIKSSYVQPTSSIKNNSKAVNGKKEISNGEALKNGSKTPGPSQCWANFNMSNPWSSSAVPEPQNDIVSNKENKVIIEEAKFSNTVPENEFVKDSNDPENIPVDHHDNPMMWEEQSNKISEPGDDDIDQILQGWDERDTQAKQIIHFPCESPRNHVDKQDDGFEIDFSTPPRTESRSAKPRPSAYVRRSIDQRMRDNRPANPFESCIDTEDFRYNLRGDSQVLFSLCRIDSKHIDIGMPSEQNISKYIYPKNTSKVTEMEDTKFNPETTKKCCKFISNTFKNHREKRKHKQILRIENKENILRNEKAINEGIPSAYTRGVYPGVNVKNYLRGVPMDFKVPHRYRISSKSSNHRRITIRVESRITHTPFRTPSKSERVSKYWEKADSPSLRRDDSNLSPKKSVKFSKYLHHEDLILEGLKVMNKEQNFKDSITYNKLESKMGLMDDRDHFGSTLKLLCSAEQTTRAKRKTSGHEFDTEFKREEQKKAFLRTLKPRITPLSGRFETVKQSYKCMSKIGDTEQDIDFEHPDSVENSFATELKKKHLLEKLKDYSYLLSTNIFLEEEQEFPRLRLDFN